MKDDMAFEMPPVPSTGEGIDLRFLHESGNGGGQDMPDLTPRPITMDEWASARSSPPCIVEDYLYEDLALMIGQGGISKTTLLIFEAVCIALDIPLYGRKILKRGMTVYLTAEDDRENVVAATRAVCNALHLSKDQVEYVQHMVRPIYVGGSSFRLCTVDNDMVVVGDGTYHLASSLKSIKDDLRVLVIDPIVSFGVGEMRVNDSEQGLVVAARYLRDNLSCCLRFVQHTGQSNARNKTKDQYGGRGGTALPDGARIVHILNHVDPFEWLKETGQKLEPGLLSGIRLSTPKLKFTKPQADIFLCRRDYAFQWVEVKQAGLTTAQLEEVMRLIAEREAPPKRNMQSPDWFGHIIAAVMGKNSGEGLPAGELTENQKGARSFIKPIAERLLDQGLFEIETVKRTNDSRMQEVIRIPCQESEV